MQLSTPVHAWMVSRGPCACPSTWRPCTSCRLVPRAPPNLLGPSTQAEHHRPCWLSPGLFFSCARPRVPVFASVTRGQGWGHMAPGGTESRDTQVWGLLTPFPCVSVRFTWPFRGREEDFPGLRPRAADRTPEMQSGTRSCRHSGWEVGGPAQTGKQGRGDCPGARGPHWQQIMCP